MAGKMIEWGLKDMKSKQIAVAVVVREKKVLVQHRYRPDRGMVYEFICGKVDPGESFEETAVRELEEEVGLYHYEPVKLYTYTNEENISIGFVLFYGRSGQEPQMVNPLRQQTFYWFEFNDIPLKAFPPIDQQFILNELTTHINNSS